MMSNAPSMAALLVAIVVACIELPTIQARGLESAPPPGLIPVPAGSAAELAPVVVPVDVPPSASPAGSPIVTLGASAVETLAPFVTAAGAASANNPTIQVTLSAPADAVTMNSWAYLKESMEKVHDQVSDIMLVRNDIDSIRGDLKKQLDIWHEAELELNQENQRLQYELKRQEAEYHSLNDPLEILHDKLQVGIADEKRHAFGLQQELVQQGKEIWVEHSLLSVRSKNLTTRLESVGYQAVFDNQKVHDRELQLMTDGAALTLKGTELKDRLVDGQKELVLDQIAVKHEWSSLAQQTVDMHLGLERLKQHIYASKGEVDGNGQLKASLQAQLQTSTQELLQLQQEHNQAFMLCARDVQELQQVVQVEEARYASRRQEAFQLCNPVQQQHSVLLQWISQCTGKPVPPDVSVGVIDVDAAPLPRIFHTPTACADHTDEVVFVPEMVAGCDAAWATGGVLGGSDACSQGFAMCTRERLGVLGLTGDQCKTLPDAGNFYAINYQMANRPGDDLLGCAKNAPDVSYFGPQAAGEFKDFFVLGNAIYGSWNNMDGANAAQEFYKVKKGPGNGGVMCCREPDSPPNALTPKPDCEEGILSVRVIGASRPGQPSSSQHKAPPLGSQIMLRVGETKFTTPTGSGISFLGSRRAAKQFNFPLVSRHDLLELGVMHGLDQDAASACMLQSPVGMQAIRLAPDVWHTIRERLCDAADGAELEFQVRFVPRPSTSGQQPQRF